MQEISQGLIDSLKEAGMDGLAKDLGEVAIDSVIQDGLLQSIPIIDCIYSIAKAGFSVRDRLFLEKVIRFIHPLSKYTKEERLAMLAQLDNEELTKASQAVTLYLERMDAMEKPTMLATVFEQYMLGRITFRHMLYFFHCIGTVFIITWQDFLAEIERSRGKGYLAVSVQIDDALALAKVDMYRERLENLPESASKESGDPIMVRLLELTDLGWQLTQLLADLRINEERSISRSAFTVKVN